jgi:hypothetical protein
MAEPRDPLDPTESYLTDKRAKELGKCYRNYIYFVNNYCRMYDSMDSKWIPFHLWDEQKETLHAIHNHKLVVILKARQLGISWLSLSYALWSVLFRPAASISIFSRREEEAKYLLGSERFKGMYNVLPKWMTSGNVVETDNTVKFMVKEGSVIRAFPTNSGDSYVATLVIVDEADLAPDLNQLMRSVKPTIDNGGKMILLSRVNKSEPESEFKQIYRAARDGVTPWYPVFLPWFTHPGRTDAWYEDQKKDILSRTGALDDLYEQYPETDDQALQEKTLNKRIPPLWVSRCSEELPTIMPRGCPSINGIYIYREREIGVRYIIGADPAEGNEHSDDSALTVVRQDTGEEVCSLFGKYEPAVFAAYISQISAYYNFAQAMVERNNHGHSVIMWLEEHARRTRLLLGHDAGKKKGRKARDKAGWLSSKLGKTILYNIVTEFFRLSSGIDEGVEEGVKVVHTPSTWRQLMSIESGTLSAPQGMNDDRAVCFALAQAGRITAIGSGNSASLLMSKTKGWTA